MKRGWGRRIARLERLVDEHAATVPPPPLDQARNPISVNDYVLYAYGDTFHAGIIKRLSHDRVAISGPGSLNVSRSPSQVLIVSWAKPPRMPA